MLFKLIPRRSFSTTTHNAKSFAKWHRGLWQSKGSSEPPYDHVTQVGDPVLRRKADPVPSDMVTSPEVKFLVKNMIDVMRKYKLVGLAAPQIGISLRILVMEFDDRSLSQYTDAERKIKEMQKLPLTVFINPELKVTKFEKKSFIEGCGSVKGYNGEVARYVEVLLSGLDQEGSSKELILNGWNARIAQHEMDHLNGIIYTDIMKRDTFSCSIWHSINEHNGRVRLSFHE
ncbi:peptide deformylase, mitochondrial-like [Uranotaenia lowii]|uniref:peptide deformylase, mitochondrial-like n=1 Tax=Uranotaenia lowii TaxID=190385 RepID=UPI002479B8AB|nr:peptide deformylase, mitochondrial-like [Uranotaenia lowii]